MYAFATNLFGVNGCPLRVRITGRFGSTVWAVTDDPIDSGTPLVLDAEQLRAAVLMSALARADANPI